MTRRAGQPMLCACRKVETGSDECCISGFTDAYRVIHKEPHKYSFWDYQRGAWQKDFGVRIDHLLLSPQAVDRLENADIDRTPRGKEKASDHTPVWCELL